VLIRSWDDIGGTVVANNLEENLSNTTNNLYGDALVGFRQSNSAGFAPNAVSTTVNSKLQDIVSARDFGAVGDGIADDTVALQNFFDYIQTNDVGTALCSGTFKISAGLVMGRTGNMLTKQVTGSPVFIASTAIDTMLTITNCPELVWEGTVKVVGTGGPSYASRTCRVGIQLAGVGTVSSRMRFGGLGARLFSQIGISVGTLSTLSDLGNVRASDCGSGSSIATFLPAAWSSRVDTGSSGSTSQLTTITVDTLPPSQYTGTTQFPLMVIIAGSPYYVETVNTAASTISVFPWVDTNLTSGTLGYVFGAGVYTSGADAGILGFNQLDTLRCSIGLFATSLYGPIVNRIVVQRCGIAFAFGASPNSANVTFQLNGFYCEANVFDILRVTRARVGGLIASSYALNYGKIEYVCAARLSDNTISNGFNNLRSIAIYQNGTFNTFVQSRKNADSAASSTILGLTTVPKHASYFRDSWVVNLSTPDINENDAFGYNTDTLTLFGTGTNYSPTGTIEFRPPTSVTVNTTATGFADRVEITVADSTGITRGLDVSGGGIAAGTTVVRVSGAVVILSLPLTVDITSSAVTFSNSVATTVNGAASAKFNGFNGPALFTLAYDFAADNFVVSTLSVGSFPSTTAANLANKSNIFNTQAKFLGRGVWDTTNNRLMVASGSTDVSLWYVADGSASVTPV
jgi:hypothetical protein